MIWFLTALVILQWGVLVGLILKVHRLDEDMDNLLRRYLP
jgi:hypothetical protein